MAGGKIDPKIAAAVAQLRADFDAARGIGELKYAELQTALAAAVLTATKEIAAIRADGQKQLDEMKEEIAALRERLIMVAGAGNNI
jgi:D-tyrosyl-tRNA(Tyr) deacylase